MPSDFPKDAPAPRLCHLVKWPDFDGYGFNLHAEKTKTGQFIGKVDPGSPAELAGLREGDRIVEVNDVNIGNENHKQVVERIKAIANETKLLVLDERADAYYKAKKTVVKGSQANVLLLKTPVPRPEHNGSTAAEGDDASDGRKSSQGSEHEDRASRSSSISLGAADNTSQTSQTGSRLSTPSADRKELADAREDSSPSPTTRIEPHAPSNGTANGKDLNLNMSVAEMRAMLIRRKKPDPKKEHLDLRKKYELIQEM